MHSSFSVLPPRVAACLFSSHIEKSISSPPFFCISPLFSSPHRLSSSLHLLRITSPPHHLSSSSPLLLITSPLNTSLHLSLFSSLSSLLFSSLSLLFSLRLCSTNSKPSAAVVPKHVWIASATPPMSLSAMPSTPIPKVASTQLESNPEPRVKSQYSEIFTLNID